MIPMRDQVVKLFEEVQPSKTRWTRLDCWFANNAYTIIFVLILALITWGVIIATAIWEVAHGK